MICQQSKNRASQKSRKAQRNQMTASDFDVMLAVAYAAAFALNRQTAIVAAAFVAWQLLYLLPLDDFWMTITGATIYAVTASIFIKLKSQIRYALITISSLYYLNAIDFYLFSGVETLYYHSVGYLIGAIDLYVLWQLSNGEPRHVGVNSVVHGRFVNL